MILAFVIAALFLFGLNFYTQLVQFTRNMTRNVEPEWLKKTLRIVLYFVFFVIVGFGFLCSAFVSMALLSKDSKRK